MAQWMKATDYHLMNTGVTFESASKDLKDLFDRCEYYCKKNLAVFTDKKVLREGSDYDGVWLETQPNAGEGRKITLSAKEQGNKWHFI